MFNRLGGLENIHNSLKYNHRLKPELKTRFNIWLGGLNNTSYPSKGLSRLKPSLIVWEDYVINAIISNTSRGRQAALSYNIFPFHAIYYLFCLPAAISHNRLVFHATTFESFGNYYVFK